MSKYNDLYNHIKSEIISGQLLFGSRLPSIRKAGELFGVSRTTVQNAYFALAADGYIISEPQSGYYVFHRSNEKENNSEKNKFKNSIKYDLKGINADAESFDFNLWRRYIKSTLRQNEKLLSYGEPQGEIQLREALSDYIRDNRNVSASPDRIVIGAGIQSLLYVLCSLIEKKESISFPDKSFVKSDFLFSDYGFDVHYRYKDARIIYVSPSHMTKKGDIMTNKRKTELIKHASETGSLIIEDDYESDFLYNTRPTPSLHALSGGKNVIYLGSFSKLLLPSIRISFMVLTEDLAKKYKENIFKYSQTASKTEQFALCSFIRDGHLKSQIKKTRRFYTLKAKNFANTLGCFFPRAEIEISENALLVIMKIPFDKDYDIFERSGISVNIEKNEADKISIIFNPSGISENDFEKCAEFISKIINKD